MEEEEGSYTVRSAYNCLQGIIGGEDNTVFKSLWSLNMLQKAKILGWRIMMDKVAIKTKLVHKGIQL